MSGPQSQRRRGRPRPWWLAIPLALCCVLPVGACIEAASLGPYTTWFNRKMMARATDAGLVGQSEARVEVVLGRASNDYTFSEYVVNVDGGLHSVSAVRRTYEYFPYPALPFSKFQVHCQDGVVASLEMFDD